MDKTTADMKWIMVKESPQMENYELTNGDHTLLSLHYNKHLHTARIESADGKRMFMIEREGFLRSRTVLKNEYGVRVGYIGFEKTQAQTTEDFIELNDERFYYAFQNDPAPELILYKTNKNEPLLVCSLAASPIFIGAKEGIHTLKNSSLLISLCWFRLMMLRENGLAFAH